MKEKKRRKEKRRETNYLQKHWVKVVRLYVRRICGFKGRFVNLVTPCIWTWTKTVYIYRKVTHIIVIIKCLKESRSQTELRDVAFPGICLALPLMTKSTHSRNKVLAHNQSPSILLLLKCQVRRSHGFHKQQEKKSNHPSSWMKCIFRDPQINIAGRRHRQRVCDWEKKMCHLSNLIN